VPLTWITPRIMAAMRSLRGGRRALLRGVGQAGELVGAGSGSPTGRCSRPSPSSPGSRTLPRSVHGAESGISLSWGFVLNDVSSSPRRSTAWDSAKSTGGEFVGALRGCSDAPG
jgi:hypothetical protein